MMKPKTLTTLLLVALFLFIQTAPTQAFEDYSPEAVAADTLVVRPICFAATIVGTAIFIISLPIAAISSSTGKAADVLVATPARATFKRPLGYFTELE